MTTTLTDRVPVGTRIRCTDGATATVVDHRDAPAVGRAYDYVIRLDEPDADGNRIQFAARDAFEPLPQLTRGAAITATTTGTRDGVRYSTDRTFVVSRDQEPERDFIPARDGVPAQDRIFVEHPHGSTPVLVVQDSIRPAPSHRPAVTAVTAVCAVVAENGGTTLVAPPPQARRAYSPDSLASLLVGTPPGVAHQVDVEHAVRIATLESILAEARQETQRAQDALIVERAKAEAFSAELEAERANHLAAHQRAAANGAALLAARPVVDAARELVNQWTNPDGGSLRESALSTALTVAVRTHAEATR
ncbi:hypothetical protein [Cellulosimicrobium cellulans]|uniref:hypothetical protein n=1 Tax=Cellulosimicrobium cellulans TaxID=1710 RepID=UPI001BAD1CFF|nr:hypothetical protein [Cellulosimicrobium cellulans]QUC01200.1 hypothetical protein J5A69_08580 [Cellulosimicrobium cellulans]